MSTTPHDHEAAGLEPRATGRSIRTCAWSGRSFLDGKSWFDAWPEARLWRCVPRCSAASAGRMSGQAKPGPRAQG